jgi:hypothetical protein
MHVTPGSFAVPLGATDLQNVELSDAVVMPLFVSDSL